MNVLAKKQKKMFDSELNDEKQVLRKKSSSKYIMN